MISSGVWIRGCVYGNTFSTHQLTPVISSIKTDLEPFLLNDSACVYVCVVVYECMECKEETKKLIIYTLTYTARWLVPKLISVVGVSYFMAYVQA
jgi:hypothetical protein